MEHNKVTPDATFQLYLVTYDKPATVTVTVAKPRFDQTLHIERDSSSLVTLNYTYMITEKQVTSKAVLVTSDVAITVIGFYSSSASADAMTCLPLEDLGTEYYISTSPSGTARQFAVANGLQESVVVNITVTGSVMFNGVNYGSGESFSFTLNSQQVIQFQSSSDLTATRVSSTRPVAVFSGQKCFAGVNTFCDALVEQLYPVDKWGHYFVVFPLLNHTQDSLTIVTSYQDTQVNINSEVQAKQYNFLDAGSYTRIALTEVSVINSSKPIMVTYLIQESKSNLVASYDPFFVNVPPSLKGRNYYKFVTQKEYFNFLLVVTEISSADEFYLDRIPLTLYSFDVRNVSDFTAFEVFLDKTEGQHEIFHESLPFSIYVYGIADDVSYGYSMGQETVYPDAPSSTPSEGNNPEGTLTCLYNEAEYQLPLSLVSEADLNILDIHLEDPLCLAVPDGNFAFIQIPFDGCETNVVSKDGSTYYENTIYGTIPGTSIHRIEIPVRCEMEMNETLGLSIHPKVTDVVSLGHYNVSLKLYRTEDYTNQVAKYPYEVDLHGHLHVEFKVESDDENLQLLVENCKASPSLEDTQQIYNVIQHGCPQDSTLQSHIVDDPRLQRFSVHVFKFGSLEEVYLSCNVIICHNGTFPNRCTQGCLASRHKRALQNSPVHLGAARLSQGPIVFKSDELENSHTVPSSVLVLVVGVMGVLAILGLAIQKRYLKKKGYTLLQDEED
ncbi:uncharacterized protein PAF06_000435 [Gastrophryne carolinensis]